MTGDEFSSITIENFLKRRITELAHLCVCVKWLCTLLRLRLTFGKFVTSSHIS
jgi:hypothetical protein